MKTIYSNLTGLTYSVKRDRRSVERFPLLETVKVTAVNDVVANLQLKGINVSVQGIGFTTDVKFKKHDFLKCILIFKNSSIMVPVTVKIVTVGIIDSGFYVGCEYVGLLPYYYDQIKQILTCTNISSYS